MCGGHGRNHIIFQIHSFDDVDLFNLYCNYTTCPFFFVILLTYGREYYIFYNLLNISSIYLSITVWKIILITLPTLLFGSMSKTIAQFNNPCMNNDYDPTIKLIRFKILSVIFALLFYFSWFCKGNGSQAHFK